MSILELVATNGASSQTYQARKSELRRDSRTLYTMVVKRAFDLILAMVLLPIILPIIAVLWAFTVRDGGSGFYGHRRIGRHGQSFRCWKIRTMQINAEQRLKTYLVENPEAAAEWACGFKLTNDPRITRLGAFLRASSLDELPQIWNVLAGEMSFVGPRPVVRAELRRYGAMRTAYLSMRPGITGLWQVSGRNNVSYEERVMLDVTYVSTVSFLTDIKLLVKTARAVTDRTGC
ncbi:glycosyl transferase [Puniceibacterium sp. IMCC21224]|nr:glycosyl transferase [Puniceibacterium sp. IMCC21224]